MLNCKKGHILFSLIIVLLAACVFAFRYTPAFSHPNFYAEDGKVFLDNVLHKNVFAAVLSGFNGYLIAGLYVLVEFSVLISKLFGLEFYQLAQIMAITSCLFLGLTVSLPFILFRKQLGLLVSLGAVLISSFVAMPMFDYAIIGTIGNLKFAFLYWAFLFIIYRHLHSQETNKVLFCDLVLLLAVLTYAPAIFLLPFILIPYLPSIKKMIISRSLKSITQPQIISALVLMAISAIYLVIVYLKGIPKIPGYLDTPYQWDATIKIVYRSTWYAWLYPITATMRDSVTTVLLAIFVYVGIKNKANRYVTLLGIWSIFIATTSFVVNRPGISSYFLTYTNSPDQFFYAQSLIFIFTTFWLIRKAVVSSTQTKTLFVIAIGLFLYWSYPAGGSFGKTLSFYQSLGTARDTVNVTCKSSSKYVTLQEYPLEEWKWHIERSIVCK